MNNLILTIHVFTSGVTGITVPATDPTHIYYMQTSTNLSAGWDNADAQLFVGSASAQVYYQYPPRQQEFFRLMDLGQVL